MSNPLISRRAAITYQFCYTSQPTLANQFRLQQTMDCPAASTLSPSIFSDICIISNASNNVPVMLAFIGCCTNTTSSTAQVTSDYCYHYCNLTSFNQEMAMGSCLNNKLNSDGVDVGGLDIEYLGNLAASPVVVGSASGFASLSPTGNLSSSLVVQTTSGSNSPMSSAPTGAVITPLGTATKSTGATTTATSNTPTRTSGGQRKKLDRKVGWLAGIALLGYMTGVLN